MKAISVFVYIDKKMKRHFFYFEIPISPFYNNNFMDVIVVVEKDKSEKEYFEKTLFNIGWKIYKPSKKVKNFLEKEFIKSFL